MPELPEVETARRGIAPHLVGRRIRRLEVREWRLRWPIGRRLPATLRGRAIEAVGRRGKYLLIRAGGGTLLWHLGMSGSLRALADPPPPGPHDHVDLELSGGTVLRFRDPRRFGSLHWTRAATRCATACWPGSGRSRWGRPSAATGCTRARADGAPR